MPSGSLSACQSSWDRGAPGGRLTRSTPRPALQVCLASLQVLPPLVWPQFTFYCCASQGYSSVCYYGSHRKHLTGQACCVKGNVTLEPHHALHQGIGVQLLNDNMLCGWKDASGMWYTRHSCTATLRNAARLSLYSRGAVLGGSKM